MKYKEGFSRQLVESFIKPFNPTHLLDPFAGIGTAPLVASWNGSKATGIEVMPVGVRTAESISYVANGAAESSVCDASKKLIAHLRQNHKPSEEYGFSHVKITEGAFSTETERELARARQFLDGMDDPKMRQLLNFACMSVLEESSFTRKDGQYLRWDHRAKRKLRAKFDIGPITPFPYALQHRLTQIQEDMSRLKLEDHEVNPEFKIGSSLELLSKLPDRTFDFVLTSPPYANRYDYSRTYALELAWLGYDQTGFSNLRQSLLSATVENKSKITLLKDTYLHDPKPLEHATSLYKEQGALHEVLGQLRMKSDELSNKNVIRLIEGYFLEMALVIVELGRLVSQGGVVIMVNDNVQYHGEEIPVDFILADFAEGSGFKCENIWALPRGKGNSSQQMVRFGRRELRKCIYRWIKVDD